MWRCLQCSSCRASPVSRTSSGPVAPRSSLGGSERLAQAPHRGLRIESLHAPVPSTGSAAADGEDRLAERAIGADRLVVVPAVLGPELAAGFERHPVQGELMHGFECQEGGVLAYLLVGRAQRPFVAVAEAVPDDEITVLPAERAVVGEHDPRAHAHALGIENLPRPVERVVATRPGRGPRPQATPGPDGTSNRTVECGRLRDDVTVLGVQGRRGPDAVVGGSDDNAPDPDRVET